MKRFRYLLTMSFQFLLLDEDNSCHHGYDLGGICSIDVLLFNLRIVFSLLEEHVVNILPH